MQNRFIYTLGTGLRSAEDFIEILLAYDIRAVNRCQELSAKQDASLHQWSPV